MHAERNVCRGERLPRHLDLAYSPRFNHGVQRRNTGSIFSLFHGPILSGMMNPPWIYLQARTNRKEQSTCMFDESLEISEILRRIFNEEDREVSEWKKNIRVLFQRFFLCQWTDNCNDLESGTRRKYECLPFED